MSWQSTLIYILASRHAFVNILYLRFKMLKQVVSCLCYFWIISLYSHLIIRVGQFSDTVLVSFKKYPQRILGFNWHSHKFRVLTLMNHATALHVPRIRGKTVASVCYHRSISPIVIHGRNCQPTHIIAQHHVRLGFNHSPIWREPTLSQKCSSVLFSIECCCEKQIHNTNKLSMSL